MRKFILSVILIAFIPACLSAQPFIKRQVELHGNNIKSFIWSTGVFNQDLRTNNTQGFEWMSGTGKFAMFTAGLTVGGYINNELTMGVACYNGEYCPGYSENGVYHYDERFKLYSVKRGDNHINNPDWMNWGNMVPYGAPFIDVNNSGYYEFLIDTPGVKGASATVFVCISDGYALAHTPSEGFGGGTDPLHAEIHFTAWCYNSPGLENVQFLKWEIINKHTQRWDSVYFSIPCDPDLGEATDDYVGSDTTMQMVYVYNADSLDGNGSGVTYGINPPAAAMMLLKGPVDYSQAGYPVLKASTLRVWNKNFAVCEHDPGSAEESYRMMKGYKNDGTPYVIPYTDPPVVTKYTFTGDPESGEGWTEYSGRVENCNGSLTGKVVAPTIPADRRMIISAGSGDFKVMPGERQVIYAAQFIARGSSNKNSVTKLKNMAPGIRQFFEGNFPIAIEPPGTTIPVKYALYQNYPNPFNPATAIKFDIPSAGNTSLKVYDAVGRLISQLVNNYLSAGEYSIEWNASNYPSGVYFYQLESGSYIQTKKMVLIK